MYIGEICTRNVVICTSATGIVEAARLMRQNHVGDLVVVEERGGKRVPTGVITDRDIVVEVVALEAPLERLTIGDIQSRELITAKESDELLYVLGLMQRNGIRRIPVIDNYGALVGIATLDDLLEILADEIGTMVKLISREQARETKTRPTMPSGAEAH